MIKILLLIVTLSCVLSCAPELPCEPRVNEPQYWSQMELDLVDLINDYRVELNLVEFIPNEDLKIESDNRANVLYYLDAITHEGSAVIFKNLGSKCYAGITEILGGGYTTTNTVLASWKKSLTHNKALMNDKNTYIGVTNTVGKNGQTIYVVLFAR